MRLVAALALAGLVAACGGDVDDPDEEKSLARPICEQLASVCHGSSTEFGKHCHDVGHADSSTDADCEAERDACLAECGDAHGH